MRRAAIPIIVAAALIGAPVNAANPVEAARAAELDNLVRQDCGSCHGLTMKGGLGPPLLPEVLRDKDPEALAEIILDGVPETPMPPWRVEISPAEAAWIVERLQQGLNQ